MKKLFIIIISVCSFTCLLAIHCQAQDVDKKNTLSFNVGAGYITRQDLIFSPVIHTDLSLMNLGLQYTREATLFQKVSLNYSNFNPMVSGMYEFTEYGEPERAYPHSFNMVDLDYLIGKKLQASERSNLTAGILFTMDIQAMNYVYGKFSNFGYYSAFSLGVFGRKALVINEKSNVSATIQIPLMSWLSRSPYLVNDDEFIENISTHSGLESFGRFVGDGQLVTWNRLQTLNLEVKYVYAISEKWALGAAYVFEFIHSDKPENLLSFRNTLNLSANFKF